MILFLFYWENEDKYYNKLKEQRRGIRWFNEHEYFVKDCPDIIIYEFDSIDEVLTKLSIENRNIELVLNYYNSQKANITISTEKTERALNTEPQPTNAPQPEEQKTDKKRGRPVKTFEDFILYDNKAEFINVFELLINDKKGKDVALIILACMECGLIKKMEYPAFDKEYNGKISRNIFYKHINDIYKASENELKPYIAKMRNMGLNWE